MRCLREYAANDLDDFMALFTDVMSMSVTRRPSSKKSLRYTRRIARFSSGRPAGLAAPAYRLDLSDDR